MVPPIKAQPKHIPSLSVDLDQDCALGPTVPLFKIEELLEIEIEYQNLIGRNNTPVSWW